jgi:hypothetical protein
MKIRALAPLAVAGLALAAAAPAGAAPAPIVGVGAFARTIPFIDGDLYAFSCTATAPGAVSTSVDSCALGSVGAPAATQAGPLATTSEGVSQDPRTTSVCWTVSARYSDGSTQTATGCSTSSDLAGAGAS